MSSIQTYSSSLAQCNLKKNIKINLKIVTKDFILNIEDKIFKVDKEVAFERKVYKMLQWNITLSLKICRVDITTKFRNKNP